MESPEVVLALSMVKEAGFDPITAYRIIECESGGNTEAHNWADPHGGSHGIWQINSAHNLSMEEMVNVNVSTKFAIELMKSKRGYNHWSCYAKLYGQK